MINSKEDKSATHYQIKPITTRQLALAVLFIVASGALIAFLVVRHQVRSDNAETLNPIVIPNIIKAKVIASEPQYNESLPIVFPAIRAQGG